VSARIAFAALLCALLAACGGGGSEDPSEDDGIKTTIPVDCVAHPERCK
jgi:hypothetical protein